MKVRNIVNGNVVWFGSQGVKQYLHTDIQADGKSNFTQPLAEKSTLAVKVTFYVPHFNDNDVYQLGLTFKSATIAKNIVVTLDKQTALKVDALVYVMQVSVELPAGINTVDYLRMGSVIDFKHQVDIFAAEGKKADSFVYQQEGVAADLTQRLSILKNELWYQINYGLPLLDKIKSKAVIDASVLDIITSHPNVVRVSKFESQVLDRKYSCKATIESEFGPVQLNL